MIRGFLKYYTNGAWINQLPESVGSFGMIKLFSFKSAAGADIGLPIQFILFALAMLVTWFLLRRTLLGRSVMAMGSSRWRRSASA